MTSVVDEPGHEERETMKDRAFVLGYRTFGRIAKPVPEKTGRAIATRLGRLAYHLCPSVRAVVDGESGAGPRAPRGRPARDRIHSRGL